MAMRGTRTERITGSWMKRRRKKKTPNTNSNRSADRIGRIKVLIVNDRFESVQLCLTFGYCPACHQYASHFITLLCVRTSLTPKFNFHYRLMCNSIRDWVNYRFLSLICTTNNVMLCVFLLFTDSFALFKSHKIWSIKQLIDSNLISVETRKRQRKKNNRGKKPACRIADTHTHSHTNRKMFCFADHFGVVPLLIYFLSGYISIAVRLLWLSSSKASIKHAVCVYACLRYFFTSFAPMPINRLWLMDNRCSFIFNILYCYGFDAAIVTLCTSEHCWINWNWIVHILFWI